MPSVSYNGQSFSIDGRRLWILAASLQYARIPPGLWAERIAATRQAGFNTIETACPWIVHEPRKGRFHFSDGADVRHFLELCGRAGMRVILRPGPYVGAGFDGGGLPSWLQEEPGLVLREGNELFLDRVGRYFRKLLAEITELQATKGGPLLLVQVEHDWRCANEAQVDRYLREITRIVRECGIAVPLINANNLWLDSAGTIDTWRGGEDLLVNLRQLRTVQPDAPRLVSAFEEGARPVWGAKRTPGTTGQLMLRRLAEILAAGTQPIVTPFHGGTNFGFLAGRLPGPDSGTVTTSAAGGAPLGEAGVRGETYHQIRRLVSFANSFGHVFADLDPDYQPVALDPTEVAGPGEGGNHRRKGSGGGAAISVVPLRGVGGRVVFVFMDGSASSTTLLLDNGLRLPVDVGDQPVGWYVLEADIHGRGRLDYANLCPFAIIDRTLVVLQGPGRADALLSVNGTPFHATVPSGGKPLVVEHRGLRFAICNQEQIATAYCDEKHLFVGIQGMDAEGKPLLGRSRAWRIDSGGAIKSLAPAPAAAKPKRSTIRLSGWHVASAREYAEGTSPRFASLSGPKTLPGCGAPTGYGWYRLIFKVGKTQKRVLALPQSGGRLHLYLDGKLLRVVGHGPGADAGPIETSLSKGDRTIGILADNSGRFADGNDLDQLVGLYGHLYAVKTLRGSRPKQVKADPVDPFAARGFILEVSGLPQGTDKQVEWTFTHTRKAPILVDVSGARAHGTFMLNGTPLAYYAGSTGGALRRLLLEHGDDSALKRGKNVLRFAADVGQPDAAKQIIAATTIYVCEETLTSGASWGFAKWEPPAASRFASVSAAEAARNKGFPAWWRSAFEVGDLPAPLWFDTAGLSKGQALVNGHDLGRYFTATATGRAIGPQQRLFVPEEFLHRDRPNEVIVFDEHGFAPHKAKMVIAETGELD